MSPSVVTALAWIGALYVTLLIAVASLFVISEVVARVRRWRDRRADQLVSRSRVVSGSHRVSTEPDPIESYQQRPAPVNCQHEPPYPGAETVLLSLRDPGLVAHRSSWLCAVECPHPIGECGAFRAVNPIGSGTDLRIRS